MAADPVLEVLPSEERERAVRLESPEVTGHVDAVRPAGGIRHELRARQLRAPPVAEREVPAPDRDLALRAAAGRVGLPDPAVLVQQQHVLVLDRVADRDRLAGESGVTP